MSHVEDNNRDRDLAGLLGEPPILPGESENRYAALRAEVERTIQPKNIFEQMRVQTLTDTIWEEMRYKRFGAKLIDGARVNALAVLMTPFMSFSHRQAATLAECYYGSDPKKREAAVAPVHPLFHLLDRRLLSQMNRGKSFEGHHQQIPSRRHLVI